MRGRLRARRPRLGAVTSAWIERYFRPTEVDELCGDASKAARVLGWRPTTRFHDLVRIMLEADLREAGLDPDTLLSAAEPSA